MLLYLTNFIQVFLPVSLITGMLLALWSPVYGKRAVRPVIVSIAAGLLVGIIVYYVSLRHETITAARTLIYGTALLAAMFNGGTLLLPGKKSQVVSLIGWGGALFFTLALSALTIFSFFGFITEQALSATSVLNTEFILNIGGMLAGVFFMAFLIPLVAHLGVKNDRGMVSWLLLFLSALLIMQWTAEVLLGLMRLELLELTSLRVSTVAKVTKYSKIMPYCQALVIAAFAIVFFMKRPVITSQDLTEMEKAELRKARSRALFDKRWFKSALASVIIIITILFYHDLYASRPPRIAPPVNQTPDGSGLIKIGIDDVKDGNLHRYSYVTDDGHVVRFCLINRSRGLSKISAVYDACMLCGDVGYRQEKNEVICSACNVRIFVPSIGKAGGCNPIPLNHDVEGEHVVVSTKELDNGAQYFSQVVSKKVKDPVTGKVLDSKKAPYRYEYKGRRYFFESEESGEQFKKSPETYLGEHQSNY